MKTKHLFLTGTIAIALAGVLLTGCAKKSSTAAPTNTDDYTAAQDDANAQFAIQDSKNISDGAAKGQSTDRTAGGCEVYRKFDTVIASVTDTALDIFFGNSDCTCTDGRKRRGHIFVFWNGKPYFDSNSSVTMTFQNYFVNDIGVTGARVLTNVGNNKWNFTANLTLTYPAGGGTATWNSTRTNTTQTVSSVLYWVVNGSASGTSRTGNSYTITITSPLYATVIPWWLGGCAWIEAGKVTINGSNFKYPIYVDFGAIGTCDNQATATINSKVYTFNMW
jgi:hypothetical protein